MAIVGGDIGFRLLKWISPHRSTTAKDKSKDVPDFYESANDKLTTHYGSTFFDRIRDRTVVDFGCGRGEVAVELAQRGAGRVIGVEIQQRFRDSAIQLAKSKGVAERCVFVESYHEKADFVLSLDAFEHFADPAAILAQMADMVVDTGEVWVSFGMPWYHPRGGHLFSVFPWAHLVFTEDALIRWRSEFKDDGATRFDEVAGGLNQMTIARFERLIAESPFDLEEFRLKPIKGMRPLHSTWTREFTTSLIFSRLKKAHC